LAGGASDAEAGKRPKNGFRATVFTKRRGTILVREQEKAVSCRFWAFVTGFTQGGGGFGRPGGPERQNRSSKNGGKWTGFKVFFGVFERKLAEEEKAEACYRSRSLVC